MITRSLSLRASAVLVVAGSEKFTLNINSNRAKLTRINDKN